MLVQCLPFFLGHCENLLTNGSIYHYLWCCWLYETFFGCLIGEGAVAAMNPMFLFFFLIY